MEEVVVIVGAGQSGLATGACLATHGIPHTILERDDCVGSLWRKRSYDRVHLHLAKQYCALPHAPHPPSTPTFIPKPHFIRYLDDYAAQFGLEPRLNRNVESAWFDEGAGRWRITARNAATGEAEEYVARFLVVATGENDEAVVPEVPGLESFEGEVVHSSKYRSGEKYREKSVLVVGAGNSGMEIALDLCESGAQTSIVVRSPLHVIPREIFVLGLLLVGYLPLHWVEILLRFLSYLKFGDTAKYGIYRPKEGPFRRKANTPIYPVLDVGTFRKIKSGDIQVLPSLDSIKGNLVRFVDGRSYQFDAIILATGYRSAVKHWLKENNCLIGDDGMAKKEFPNHWKGENGLYCAGLIRKGIYGSGQDAQYIANDINNCLECEKASNKDNLGE